MARTNSPTPTIETAKPVCWLCEYEKPPAMHKAAATRDNKALDQPQVLHVPTINIASPSEAAPPPCNGDSLGNQKAIGINTSPASSSNRLGQAACQTDLTLLTSDDHFNFSENRGQTGRYTGCLSFLDVHGCVWGRQTLPACRQRPVFADGLLSVEPAAARWCVRARRRTPLIPADAPYGYTAAGRPTPPAFPPPPGSSASLPPTIAGSSTPCPGKHREPPYRNAPRRSTTATPPPPPPFSPEEIAAHCRAASQGAPHPPPPPLVISPWP